MKKLFPIILFALMASLVSCSDDDEKTVSVNSIIKSFIEQKYNGATIREAEYDYAGLLEVEFIHDNLIKEAYFNSANKWLYTEWDVAINSLPKAVSEAIALAYPDFRVDDANFVETETNLYYEVEIDKAGVEQWIFVTTDGTIISNGNSLGNKATATADKVKKFIEQNYPSATILSAHYNSEKLIEVEIRHENIRKELYLDDKASWVYTKWDVPASSLPSVVTETILQSYPDYRIDDVDYIVTPEATFYKIEVERGNFESRIYITPDATILN